MAFVLEKVSTEDQERILRDAECDPDKLHDLHYVIKVRTGPEQLINSWAIDHERGVYLINGPILIREQVPDSLYFIFFKGKFYDIETKSSFESVLRIVDIPPDEDIEELQETIREAFHVFGRYGWGPLNKEGKPEYSIEAQFVEFFEANQ